MKTNGLYLHWTSRYVFVFLDKISTTYSSEQETYKISYYVIVNLYLCIFFTFLYFSLHVSTFSIDSVHFYILLSLWIQWTLSASLCRKRICYIKTYAHYSSRQSLIICSMVNAVGEDIFHYLFPLLLQLKREK